jgi:polyketide cyclase/dehydrase/lipid transport protein
MVLVAKRREVRAAADRVWDELVDWENESTYWPNVSGIRVLKSEGTKIEREATVGPRAFAKKTRQTIVLEPKKSIRLSFAGDEVVGKRGITVVPLTDGRSKLEVTWELELSRIPGLVQNLVRNQMVSSQISKATDAALEKIAAAAEGRG